MKDINIQGIINFILFLFLIVYIIIGGIFISSIEKEVEFVEKIIEKEVVVERIEYIDIRTQYVYNITERERLLLAQLVYREARGESFDTQVGVVSVVFNRLADGYWGNTIHDIIYAAGQFTVAKSLQYTIPNEINYKAVDYVLLHGSQLPIYVMYFNAGAFVREPYICYEGDNTYFSYQQKDLIKHMGNRGD